MSRCCAYVFTTVLLQGALQPLYFSSKAFCDSQVFAGMDPTCLGLTDQYFSFLPLISQLQILWKLWNQSFFILNSVRSAYIWTEWSFEYLLSLFSVLWGVIDEDVLAFFQGQWLVPRLRIMIIPFSQKNLTKLSCLFKLFSMSLVVPENRCLSCV